MVDDITEPAGPAPDTGRSRRPPPTIDLEPTSSETHPAPAEAVAEASSDLAGESHPHVAPEVEPSAEEIAAASAAADDLPPRGEAGPPPARPISPWVVAPFSGAVAAALVIGVGWMLGWPQVQPPSAAPQLTTVVEGINARVNGLEAKLGKADSTAAARLDTLDKSLAAVRGDVAALRAQSDKIAATANELKAMPREASSQIDLSALNARLDQIERLSRSQSAALAQADKKIADARPADDLPLRRVVAAALLDVAVRHGEPYATALATAKSLAPSADALKPLEMFASTGVPSPGALDRDLLTIVPKLSPQPQEGTTSGSSIVDRLQAGAAKLVRIERTDAAGTDRGAIVARITAAALRNDFTDARRELKTLAPADRAPAQAWLDKADARDAALAASRQFADEAMAALANVSQN
ncbi:COG4223 family protein [Bradyrhizobium sp. STM 3557]|uniref:COG4223 family protein n=1 Tax=Bradyrhizobium sp. STM 3557 TaxID=578920 RepID=UPI00388FDC8A